MYNRVLPAMGVGPTVPRETARSVSVVARRDIDIFAALIRCAACVVVKGLRWRSVPTSSLFSRARTPVALTTKVTRPLVARKRRPSYVACQASTTQ